jgi:IS30 family transposase
MNPSQITRINEMRSSGMSWRAIGQQFGLHHEAIRRAVDPEYRAHRNALARKRNNVSKSKHASVMRDEAQIDGERLLREVPADTRTPMQRALGDPICERSALGRKLMEAGHAR